MRLTDIVEGQEKKVLAFQEVCSRLQAIRLEAMDDAVKRNPFVDVGSAPVERELIPSTRDISVSDRVQITQNKVRGRYENPFRPSLRQLKDKLNEQARESTRPHYSWSELGWIRREGDPRQSGPRMAGDFGSLMPQTRQSDSGCTGRG